MENPIIEFWKNIKAPENGKEMLSPEGINLLKNSSSEQIAEAACADCRMGEQILNVWAKIADSPLKDKLFLALSAESSASSR